MRQSCHNIEKLTEKGSAIKERVEHKEKKRKGKLATRRWRSRKDKQRNNESQASEGYRSRATFGKAKRKVENALPKSPTKKAAVVKRLALDILKVKLPGISEKRTSGLALSEETIMAVHNFYASDSISRVMPGKVDFVVVRAPGQAKTKHQKRHMVMTLGEAFESLKVQNPDLNIGKSKFAELRPPHVLLTS